MQTPPIDPAEIVAKLDQKAIRLSAMLRDIDNHPVELEAGVRQRLAETLEMLEIRIAATRALLAGRAPEAAPRP